MKKPNLQRLAQRSKIYLRKASPTILSGLGAAGVIVTSVLAVRATPKALRKIRAWFMSSSSRSMRSWPTPERFTSTAVWK